MNFFREYIDTIRYIDKGIRQMEELIDGYYGNDGRTAFVMSFDHGAMLYISGNILRISDTWTREVDERTYRWLLW